MSVTSGFFNSLNGDRRYYAEEVSAIFDGVINDGVFANIGTAFTVKANSKFDINVGVGRAWFNSAWILNDAILPLTIDISELLLDRWDAIVIEIDHSTSVRSGSIKIVKGTPSSSAEKPTLIKTDKVNQYPLAYIFVKAGATEITQANITSMIGTSSCPYVTGILQVQTIDNIVAQWYAQWEEWFAGLEGKANVEIIQWANNIKHEFAQWMSSMDAMLSEDAAVEMAAKILEIEEKFAMLAKEGIVFVHENIQDSDYDDLLDSNGLPIVGKAYVEIKVPIPDGSITTSKLAEGAVITSKLEDGAVITSKVANESITSEKIAENAITPAKLSSQARELFAPAHIYSTTDITAGSTPLADGTLYLVYE